ncbi:hypothetical protein TSUD_18920 [Trifolium subterraneum]|uniref:Pectate lyase n=1 Tax=Trifolium subterraneum TaxID=3900 RepID=A0A2Z6N0I6_TRISU|nr:hypothetical protein TSUD_18920 [Trifolium subterraneum]
MQVTIAYNHFGEGLIQRMPRVETPEGQWKGWNWRSEGDLYLNGAYFTASGAGASASYARASSLGAKSSAMVGTITSNAGALGCKRGRQC